MIFFIATHDHPELMNDYLASWGQRLRSGIRVLSYEQIAVQSQLPRGTYIFSDLERLDADHLALARHASDALRTAGGCVLLNDPNLVLRRGPFLGAMYRAGRNPFNVHAVTGDLSAVRFPAFVRRTNWHNGALTPPLNSPAQIAEAVAALQARPIPADEMLIVEYCETIGDDHLYRKYGAFIVADRIIPRHILFSENWMTKIPDRVDAGTVAEEVRYMTENPHGAEILDICRLAKIEFGRIDYAVHNGAMVTWEINTNPTIVVPAYHLSPLRAPLQPMFMDPFARALEGLIQLGSGPSIRYRAPHELICRLKLRRRDRAERMIRRRIANLAGAVLRRLKRGT